MHAGLRWAAWAVGASGLTSGSADDASKMDEKRLQERCRYNQCHS